MKYRAPLLPNDIKQNFNCNLILDYNMNASKTTLQKTKIDSKVKYFFSILNDDITEVETDVLTYDNDTVSCLMVGQDKDYIYLVDVLGASNNVRKVDFYQLTKTTGTYTKYRQVEVPNSKFGYKFSHRRVYNDALGKTVTNLAISNTNMAIVFGNEDDFESIIDWNFVDGSDKLNFGSVSCSQYSSSKNLSLFKTVGSGSGIDLTKDPRPLHYTEQDGTPVQVVTERCLTNPSSFNMENKEVYADGTRLLTEANIKAKNLDEPQVNVNTSVSHEEREEEKSTLWNRLKRSFLNKITFLNKSRS